VRTVTPGAVTNWPADTPPPARPAASGVGIAEGWRGTIVHRIEIGPDQRLTRVKVVAAIEHEIGKIARPVNVWIVPDMPKTRSGKIMRRVIAGISNFTDVGDTTTLANPEIVNDIRHRVQAAKLARGQAPRQLTPQEAEEIKAYGHTE
jgi:hypothetical protein